MIHEATSLTLKELKDLQQLWIWMEVRRVEEMENGGVEALRISLQRIMMKVHYLTRRYNVLIIPSIPSVMSNFKCYFWKNNVR
jgi:hypothetical protein